MGHGLDQGRRTADTVATGKDPLAGRHQRGGIDLDCPPWMQFYSVLGGDETKFNLLTNRRDEMIGLDDKFTVGDRHNAASAALVRRAQGHLDDLNAPDPPIGDENLGWVGQEVKNHPFLFGRLDLFMVGGHFLFTAAIDQMDFLDVHPQRRAGTIHGDIATADHHQFFAKLHGNTLIDIVMIDPQQKIDAKVIAGQRRVFIGDLHRLALMGADTEKDRGIALFRQVAEGEIPAHLLVIEDPPAQGLNDRHLLAKHRLGQPIFGNPGCRHAARHRFSLIDIDGIPFK